MNTTRLRTPGCIPEDTSFVAPNGVALAGALQSGGEAKWPVLFTPGVDDPRAPDAFEYVDGDGPAGPDWETVELDREAVFVDEGGAPWLARHLIPADAPALSEAAVEFARRDYYAASAARMAAETLSDLEKARPAQTAPRAGGPVNDLIQRAAALKSYAELQAEQLKRTWLKARGDEGAALVPAADRPAGVGIQPDMVVLPVQPMGAACDAITAPVRVAVGIQGGAVQWALASEGGVKVMIVDFDVDDGGTDYDLRLVTDDDGDQSPANVWTESPDIRPDYFRRLDVAPDVDGSGETAPHYLESDNTRWMVTGTIMAPGPDGMRDSFTYFVEAESSIEAGAKAHAIVAADYPKGTKTDNVRILPPSAEKGGAA